jgi:probable rRNA maturation factor
MGEDREPAGHRPRTRERGLRWRATPRRSKQLPASCLPEGASTPVRGYPLGAMRAPDDIQDDMQDGQALGGRDATPEITLHAAAGAVDAVRVDLGRLTTQITAAVAAVVADGAAVARLHVELVGDAAMDGYHRRHSGVPGTTDVLTFLGSAEGEPIDVDIIVCIDEATRRAAELGHSVDREVLLYALHGLLHCIGHDDHDPVAYERMHAEEDRILTAIGIGPTFRPARPVDGAASAEASTKEAGR